MAISGGQSRKLITSHSHAPVANPKLDIALQWVYGEYEGIDLVNTNLTIDDTYFHHGVIVFANANASGSTVTIPDDLAYYIPSRVLAINLSLGIVYVKFSSEAGSGIRIGAGEARDLYLDNSNPSVEEVILSTYSLAVDYTKQFLLMGG